MKIVRHSFDGVIVGAGGAGLRAAIEAAPHMKLAVITKLSDIVASVPASLMVIVISEFWYSDPDSIVTKYLADLNLNTSKLSTVSTVLSMSFLIP